MIAWVKSKLIDSIILESQKFHPFETGGCLIGYWARPLYEAVITDVIGAGPKAEHSKSFFYPDSDWQEQKIAKIYKASGRMHSYLGDWHSHPNTTNANLSWRDRKTLKKISNYAPARISFPLMLIIAEDNPWHIKIWCFEQKKHILFSYGKIKLFSTIHQY